MKLFNRKTEQTSNDYYEAYKVELGAKAEENKIFSLNNFLKLEILAVAVGFIMLNQNSLTSEFKKFTDGNDALPVSMQYASLDKDLVVTQEDTNLKKIEIREDDTVLANTLDEEAFVNNTDIQLLLELLQSKMKEKQELSPNRIIISQN